MLNFAQKLITPAPPLFAELWQSLNEQGRDELDERAAILAFEAGFSRDEAEAKAAAEFRQPKESEVL